MKRIISSDSKREDRLPPGQKAIDELKVLQYDGVPEVDVSEWRFKITGLVEKEISLTYQEFTSLPAVEVYADVHCVTGWSKLDTVWEGVSPETIKELAGIEDEAEYVIIHSADNFTTNLYLEDFFREDAVFATKYNGEILTRGHGYPVRLVISGLYFYKSAKWVTEAEFVSEGSPGFYESGGYHDRGNVWKEERYSSD